MKGYPKFLNTKADYEFVRQNFEKAEWQGSFEELLATVKDWFFVKDLAAGEIGQSDETHKIIVEPADQSADGKTHNYQYELKVNPKCKLLSIGYTVEEVEAILGSDATV